MNRSRWWVASVSCGLAVALLGRGSFGHVFLTVLATLCVAVPLSGIANGAPPPRLLRPKWALGYKAYDATFSFAFSDPTRFLKYFWYDGAKRTWKLAG